MFEQAPLHALLAYVLVWASERVDSIETEVSRRGQCCSWHFYADNMDAAVVSREFVYCNRMGLFPFFVFSLLGDRKGSPLLDSIQAINVLLRNRTIGLLRLNLCRLRWIAIGWLGPLNSAALPRW